MLENQRSNFVNVNHVVQVRKTYIRWLIVFMLFCVTAVNYADRATISIAGPAIAKELKMDSIAMGYIFSAFGWAYVIAQLPGGWFLDRFGSKMVYAFSIFFWSLFTLLQGTVGFLPVAQLLSCCFVYGLWLGYRRLHLFLRIAGLLLHGSQRKSAVLLLRFLIRPNISLP